jgi:flagellar hook-associated protein 3 FlgL
MRVSDTMLSELNLASIQGGRERFAEAQEVASTGRRVNRPSDDPVATGFARVQAARERRAAVMEKLTERAVANLDTVDNALGQVNDVLSRARELAIQGANDHYNASDRVNLADEIRSLRTQLLSLSNTQLDGEYVFSGLATRTAPFDDAGTYVGDGNLRQLELAPGQRLTVQLDGAEVFGAGPGGTNAFTTLDAIATALEADDHQGVHAMLADLSTVIEQSANARSKAGTRQEALLQAQAAAVRIRQDAQTTRASLVEANPFEAFSDLVKAENALRQAVSVAARIQPPSLLEQGG